MTTDPYLWLEDIESESALSWVKDRNRVTEERLRALPFYREIENDVRSIVLAKERLPVVTESGGFISSFWQDENHTRGLWRRTPVAEFKKPSPEWEILLDIDKLAADEGENWVWRGSKVLPTKSHLCLLHFSRGGKDAAVIREFDLRSKSFVKGGFELPEAKGDVAWLDENTLLVSTDFGHGTMTASGYPRQVRRWRRGQDLRDAELLFEAEVDDVSAYGFTSFNPAGAFPVIGRFKSFYEWQYFLPTKNGLKRLPLPDDANLTCAYLDRGLVLLRSDWNGFRQGQVISISLRDADQPPRLVFDPPEGVYVGEVTATASAVFVNTLEQVRGRLVRLTLENDVWTSAPVPGVDAQGNLAVESADSMGETLIARQESFLSPPSLWLLGDKNASLEKLKSLPERFDASGMVVESFSVASRDGVMIPYSVIRPRDLKHDGKAPTILYGYGGFEYALTPFYLGDIGKVWLEKTGGVYVLANLRGGGEFGSDWHKSVLKENRQKVYDDFIAVAEDLIRRRITSPAHLGIMGGSNGGLLVGATMVQRPELFSAAVCQVPLLDMLRYHKLLAGHSWMAEYGDPDDPRMREVLLRYSPYHNLKMERAYPEIFLMTSTKDDRVHPAHARKMAARMLEMNKPFLYFENLEGGHGAAANLEQRVTFTSLTFAYLRDKLVG